jgi:hypothetical protein
MLARSLTRSALRSSSNVNVAAKRTIPALARPIQTSAPTTPKATATPKSAFGVRSFSTTMSPQSAHIPDDNTRPAVDKVVQDIADYVHDFEITSPLAVSYLHSNSIN